MFSDLPPAPEDITNDLAKLVNNEDYSDVRFDVNGTIFHGHKAILSVRSEYFKAMFSSDFPTQPVNYNSKILNFITFMVLYRIIKPYDSFLVINHHIALQDFILIYIAVGKIP